MKKLLSLILALTLLLSLAACSGGTTGAVIKGADGPNAEEETTQAKIDYENTDRDDWIYKSETKGLSLLNKINSVRYGENKSKGAEAYAKIALLDLSQKDDAAQRVKVFVSEMNPIQKDYFSYNWTRIYQGAKDAFTDGGFAIKSIVIGYKNETDFNINNYSQEKLQKLNEEVYKILNEERITMQWKNLPEGYFG